MTELAAQTLTAFTIGLLGSGHCLAMCGGIMGALSMRAVAASDATSDGRGALIATSNRGTLLSQLLLYSTGRLLSYAMLGMALGLIGAVLVTALEPARLVLRGLAGGLLIAMGLYLAGLWHGILVLERFGHRLWQRLGSGLRQSQGGALVLGMGWGLLPCGLVYGTLAWAGSAADPMRAGWLMLAFGAGTLPAVLGGGWFGSALLGVLRKPGFRITAGVIVVLFGIWTLIGGVHGQHGEHHGAIESPNGERHIAASITASGENTGCS
ncbi:MAG: sulfite exporter TauE/SafE family protein [Gammaproteobacteria bacterium]|nr:MAG: sulfite exporter TauE/SafE family protein [Gammaproteobacteria bacterium]